jgi:hypothetical protein
MMRRPAYCARSNLLPLWPSPCVPQALGGRPQQLGNTVARPHDFDAQVAAPRSVFTHILEPLQLLAGIFVLDLIEQQFPNPLPVVRVEHREGLRQRQPAFR